MPKHGKINYIAVNDKKGLIYLIFFLLILKSLFILTSSNKKKVDAGNEKSIHVRIQ